MSEIKDIEAYLDDYCSVDTDPGFAVMLNGKWGAGKTYFIEQFRARKKNEGINSVYISLNGASTYQEFQKRVFQSVFPLLGGPLVQALLVKYKLDVLSDIHVIEKLAENVAKISPRMDAVKSFFNRGDTTKDEDIQVFSFSDIHFLVFDDLERCSIEPYIMLGYINHFVEHDRKKVILLSYETKIDGADTTTEQEDSSSYALIREKVIGQTFHYEPPIEDILPSILNSQQPTELRTFYSTNSRAIIRVFNDSEFQNLRLLIRGLYDFGRLYRFIPKKYIKSERLKTDLLRTFFAFHFETRSGDLDVKHINGLGARQMAARMERYSTNTSPLAEPKSTPTTYPGESIFAKYTFPHYGFVLNEPLWQKIFLAETVTEQMISADLIDSDYDDRRDKPAWTRLWYFFNLEDDECTSLITRVEQDLSDHKIQNASIVLHVFGIFLALSEMGVVSKSAEDLKTFFVQYVDGLVDDGLLNISNTTLPETDEMALGLTFHKYADSTFREFRKFINHHSVEIEKNGLKQKAEGLMEMMNNDFDEFKIEFQRLTSWGGTFQDIPIVDSVSPEDFVLNLNRLSQENRNEVYQLLGERYLDENRGSLQAIMQEKVWLEKVRDLLEAIPDSKTLSHALRKNFIKGALKKSIEQFA